MRNLPFKPLFGGTPPQEDIQKEHLDAYREMEAKGRELLKERRLKEEQRLRERISNAERPEPPPENKSPQPLSDYNQFNGLFDNKKLIIIAIIIILLIVAIVALVYKQKRQSKAISTLARRYKRLRAAK